MQIVIELWSERLNAVIRPLQEIVLPLKPSCIIMPSDTQEYRTSENGLDNIVARMTSGAVVSLSLRPTIGKIRYALVNGPFFGGWPRAGWLGTIEYLDIDYEWIWERLLSSPGLQVACVGLEEAPELTDATMSLSGFPWTDPQLVVGAVWTPNGWLVRKGKSYLFSAGGSPTKS